MYSSLEKCKSSSNRACAKLIGRVGANTKGALCLLEIAGLEGSQKLLKVGIDSQTLLQV